MKLSRWPDGLFYAGHSGKRFAASDMPMLRSMREAYRQLLEVAKGIDWSQEGPGMALAAASIMADMRAKHEAAGRALDLLERTPAAWRP